MTSIPWQYLFKFQTPKDILFDSHFFDLNH